MADESVESSVESSASQALALVSVTKRFGTTVALDGTSIAVRRGTVHALLGENGAGKTTLMRVAFGMLVPDAGTIRIGGVLRRFKSPAEAIAAGIGMVHQHFTLVPAMTVAENVALGWRGRYDAARVRARVWEVSTRLGMRVDPDTVVGTLPVGAQQRVEIVKAVARDARVLVLDEPTAVLAPAEAKELLRAMQGFAAAGGAVVLITHKLRDVVEFADEITVLRRGRTVLTGQIGGLNVETLAEAMLGSGRGVGIGGRDREATASHPEGSWAQGSSPLSSHPSAGHRDVFTLRDVVVRDARGVERLKGIRLTVRNGEIVGVAAVEGNGQHELLRVLTRRMPVTRGTMDGPPVIGFVPEDRQRDALVLDFSLTENVALFGAGARRGTVGWSDLEQRTAALIERYDVRTPGVRARARELSGGNQQKLIVGRELDGTPETPPEALVVENPTWGLDVQATAAVHERLRQARAAGVAVVVYSSDLDEILALADRVIVVYNGTVHEVARDREVVGRAMLGVGITNPTGTNGTETGTASTFS